jgi:hypothetical protein
MSLLKDYGVFHPDGSEAVDIEESPVIDLFRGNTPIGEPPDLLAEQVIQKVKTVRVFLSPVEDANVFVNEVPDCAAFFMELI